MELSDLLSDTNLLQELLDNPLQMLPTAEQDTLRRCALVRNFGEQLYSSVLQPTKGPDFVQLITNRYIERLPGRERYTLDARTRERLLGEWSPQSPELVDLSKKLVRYFKEEPDPLEMIYHLIVAAPDEALIWLKEEIDQAAESYNLSRLYALQGILEERLPQLDKPLRQLLQELRAVYETRALWANAHYETRFYQERKQTASLLKHLRARENFWLLQLYAPGGAGKTIYLRAVIADHCVPHGWPVAKIDFDHVPHMNQVVDQPWRLLLTVADQLNSQIPSHPFNTLLASNQAYVAQADPVGHRFAHPIEPLTVQEATAKQEQIIEHFSSVMPPSQPYLLIFDTLEQLRHRQITLEALFTLLRALRARSPDLRVILSGRFNLEDPLPGQVPPTIFSHLFSKEAKTVKLKAFTYCESACYLVKKRNLPNNKALIRAIFDKSGGNPFKLVLLAEIVESDRSITAERIRAYKSADFAYLIERVVMRIQEPWVRWVLRYGIVPRQLTQRFLDEIVIPTVKQLKSGERSDDDPEKDWTSDYLSQKIDPFAIAELSSEPPHDLWERLNRYASDYSWVRPAERALVFHPEVRHPMRDLLLRHQREGRRIYCALQQAAFHYYDNLAKKHGRPQDLRDAVYHNYLASQNDDKCSIEQRDDYWLACYERYQDDDAMVKALANEVIDLHAKEDVFVSERVRALAAYALAYRRLPADRRRRPELFSQIDAPLHQAEQAHAAKYVDEAQLAVIKSYLFLAQNKVEAALELIDIAEPRDDRTCLDLALLKMYALDRSGQQAQINRLLSQMEPCIANLARATHDRDRRFAKHAEIIMLEQLARTASAQDQLPQADQYYERLLALSEDDAVVEICHYATRRVQLLAEMGQERRAQQVGEQALARLQADLVSSDKANVDQVTPLLARLRAEIALVRQQPEEAQQFLVGTEPPDQDPSWFDLHARVSVACLRVSEALNDWQMVIKLAPADALALRLEAYTGCARLYLDVLRDIDQAAWYVKQAISETATHEVTALLKLRERILRQSMTLLRLWVRLMGQQGKAHEARQMIMKALDGEAPATSKVKLWVSLLATIDENHADGSRVTSTIAWQIYKALARVPLDQRLSLFDGLVNCSTPDASAKLSSRSYCKELLDRLPSIDPDVHNPALATLRWAEVHRVFGDPDHARDLLDGIDDERLPVLIQRYRAYDRLGWRPERLSQANDEVSRQFNKRTHVGKYLPDDLVLLLLLEQLERLLHHGGKDELHRLADKLNVQGKSTDGLVKKFANALLDRLGSAWQPRISQLPEIEQFTDFWSKDSAVPHDAEIMPELSINTHIGSKGSALPPDVGKVTIKLSANTRTTIFDDQIQREYVETIPSNLVMNLEAWMMDEVTPPWQFAREFTDHWRKIGDKLSRLLLGERLRTYDNKRRQLRVDLSSDISYLPWELAQVDDRPLVMTKRFPIVYRYAPAERQLERPQAKNDVLLLRLGAALENLESRGQSQRGVDLRDLFLRHGLSVETLERPDPYELMEALRRQPASILYIEANLIESQIGPALDFGRRGFYKEQSRDFTARNLISTLGRVRGAPLIILDAPSTPSLADNVRQLCLRNAFATELLEHPAVSAVIATGLADLYQVDEAPVELLVPALADGRPICEGVSRMWQTAATRINWEAKDEALFANLLAFAGTALFTREPLRVLEVGK